MLLDLNNIINVDNFIELLVRFSFNFIILLIIVRYIYFSSSNRKDYLFTFLLIGNMIFFLCFLMANIEIKLGFAFGLFALFGIIRYRTNPIPIKEMTYLFIVIGLAVLNSMSIGTVSFIELIVSNAIIVIMLALMEKVFFLSNELSKKIVYEKINLLKPDKREILIEDLYERTGITIHRVDVVSINLIKNKAKLIIYYYENNFEFVSPNP